jgi:ATP-dependent RNA helicase SUPV3L1/SUV3
MGWVAAGPVLVRLDIAERIGAELAWSARARPAPLPPDLAPRLSVRAELLPAVLRGLGFRVLPAAALAPGQFGPPAPAMVTALRRRRTELPAAEAPPATGPFAALAQLRPIR